MDTTEVIIVFVSVTLTVLIVLLSVQVFYILKEFKKALEKVNKMLGDASTVTGTVSDGVSNMSGFITGLKSGISMITSLKKGPKDE